ncbi:MAG: hypothetical protein Q8L48_23590 [Archangium sp.]|nr:hypothetical protein [Archangium sp.]
MITLQTTTTVPGVTGRQLTDFFLRCDDHEYQRWWPGTHLHYRISGHRIFMDEYVGERRVKGTGVLAELIPGKKLVWKWLGLVRVVLEFQDTPKGARVTHTICAGFYGLGRLLDPFLRLYLSPGFRRAMDEHVKLEFPRLAGVLAP